MKSVRRVLAGLVLAGLSIGAVAVVSVDDGGSDEQARCRWVKGIGVVCDTGDDTISL
jgi:hypothetical protein